jgi:cytochrome c oxidase subunit 2
MMKIVNRLLQLLLFTAMLSLSVKAQSLEEGEKLYNANCVSCHAIKERVVGPALKNVHERRDEKWLLNWIRNSQKLIKSGDPIANELSKEYNGLVMPSYEQFTDAQIAGILQYIKVESEQSALAQATIGGATGNIPAADVSASMRGKINWLIILNVILLFMVVYLVLEILQKLGQIQGKNLVNWTSINAKLLISFLVVGLIATFWEFYAHGKWTVYANKPSSEHGIIYDNMLWVTIIITGIMFVITQILLFWYAYKYRNTKGRKATYYPDNHKLELLWTAIPAIVLTILVVRGLKVWNDIMYASTDDAVKIEVFGYQFGWNARYTGADGVLGKSDFRQIGVINALGVDPYKDEAAKDDIVANELYLPVNKNVTLHFRAKDVIHSALLPHFRAQMNVVPGLPTTFTFKPTITTAEMRQQKNDPGFDYILLCNKICGGAHYRMKMKVVVVSESEYTKWLSTQSKLVEVSVKMDETTASNSQANSSGEFDKTNAAK